MKFCGTDFLLQNGTALRAWVTGTNYLVGDYVSNSGTNYICLIAHVGGTFSTDLAALKWAVQASQPYRTLGGLLANSMNINNEAVDVTDKGSFNWREILGECGIKSMDLAGNGWLDDSISLYVMNQAALSGELLLMRMISGYGDSYSGMFKLTQFSRNGAHNSAEAYSIAFSSAGAPSYALVGS
jgi:predicted secreted protein